MGASSSSSSSMGVPNVQGAIGNVGLILTLLFIGFIVLAVIATLNKRLGKNIYNLIILVASIVATYIILISLQNVLVESEIFNDLITSLLGSLEGLRESGVAFICAFILMILYAVITPIVFVIARLVIRLVVGIIICFIPPIKRLLKRKVDGQKVRIKGYQRIIGACIGVLCGSIAYFAMVGPVMAVMDVANNIISSVPDEYYDFILSDGEETLENNNVTIYSEEPETSTDTEVVGLTESITLVNDVVKPISNSFVFKTFRTFGVANLTKTYLNNVSAIEYHIDGETYSTKICTEVENLGKGVVVVATYVSVEIMEHGAGANLFTEEELQEGVYGIFSTNEVIDIIDPFIKDAFLSLCKDSFALTEEEAQTVVDTIKIHDFITMTDEEKHEESNKLTNFIVNTLGVIATLESEHVDVLNSTGEFGALLDGMVQTRTFKQTPGKLIHVFVEASEDVQKIIKPETLSKLVLSVEEERSSYTAFLANIKSGMVIANTFTGNNNAEDDTKTEDEKQEEIKNIIKEEYKVIYEHSSEEVKDVMTDIIKDAVNGIMGSESSSKPEGDNPEEGDEEVEKVDKLVTSFVAEYFDNLYSYANELKDEASADQTKEQENQEKFEKEAECVNTVIDLISHISDDSEESDSNINVETVQDLSDSVLESAVLQSTIINLSQDDDVKEQIQSYISSDDQIEIKNAIDEKILKAQENEDTIGIESLEALKQLLGVSNS